MRRSWPVWTTIACAALGLSSGAHAQGLIDAGNQAMIMHQGNLLQQQTAPNNKSSNVGLTSRFVRQTTLSWKY